MKEASSESSTKAHTVSSNIRQSESTLSVFKGSKRPPLQYDKFFVGRSYKLFRQGIKAEKTLEFYNRQLYYFCEFLGMDTEQLIEYYGPYKKVNGKNKPNLEGQQQLQRNIKNYVLNLQEKVDRKEIKPSTCVVRIPPVKLFCEMNDVLLNWTKIGKLLPRTDLVAQDEAYTREQIQKMLTFCDLRTRIIVLMLASSGIRLEALARLRHGDFNPIYSENSLVAVHVKVYRGTTAEYDSFATPEFWKSYSEYISLRKAYGEVITGDSPAILSPFSHQTLATGNAKAISDGTIQNLLLAVRSKAGLNIPSKEYTGRFTIKTAHGFRKWFNGVLKSIKVRLNYNVSKYDALTTAAILTGGRDLLIVSFDPDTKLFDEILTEKIIPLAEDYQLIVH
jgi:hypothetical protein